MKLPNSNHPEEKPKTATSQIRVVHLQRRPTIYNTSVERLFEDVRNAFTDEIKCNLQILPCVSTGLCRRLVNLGYALRTRSDVIHITGDVHYVAMVSEARRTLLTVLDCIGFRNLSGWRQALFKFLWFDAPVGRAAMVSVISEFTRKELLQRVKCNPSKVKVVHCPVSEHFRAKPRLTANRQPIVLQVGTAKNKNLRRVIAALEGISCRLSIVGVLTPEDEHLLRGAGIDYDAVCGVGVADVVKKYEEADVVILASTYEGFGLPIIEANAVGRAVVTSNICSMPEVAGDAACLVDPYDVGSIREGLKKVLLDQEYRNSLVRAGFVNVARFTAANIASQYASLYQELHSRLGSSK